MIMIRTMTSLLSLLFIWWLGPPLLLVRAFSSTLSLSLPPHHPHAASAYHVKTCINTSSCHKFPWTRLKLAAGDESATGQAEEDELPPLFVEPKPTPKESFINNNDPAIPSSLIHSIENVRKSHLLSGASAGNDDMLKQIVQAGIEFQRKQAHDGTTEFDADANNLDTEKQSLAFPTMERVPGCIATVHLKTILTPITITDSTSKDNANSYQVTIEGNADAMLSGGLLAILAGMFGGGSNPPENVVTAADVLSLDSEALTTAMGLQSVLSRGRNDGMASMVRVVQRQIKSLISGEVASPEKSDASPVEDDDERLSQLLKSTTSTSFITQSQQDKTRKPTVAMLLSGGVDSSVALHLLLRQNYNVTAFYLRIWLEDELAHLGECPWEDDLQVCEEVCEHAGNVRLETVSLGKEYRERVVQYTIEEAQRGRTPNPDIMCNSRVKFGCFLEYIEESGMEFDHVASGHYAQLEDEVLLEDNSSSSTIMKQQPQKRLFRAPDPVKDQSYFLCALTQQQLSKVIFPIGSYQKSEVRELATHFELPNRNRPDSQGLCFLGKVRFDDFLASYLGNKPGDVVDAMNGEVIGRHKGMWYHTVGQRKGIGKVMFPLATAKGPWYVVAKDQKRDIVYVSNRYEEEDFARARSEFEVEDVRWILGKPPVETQSVDGESEGGWEEVRFEMKIRHGPRIVQGTLLLKGDGSTGNVCLDNKDGGLAPGQYVVFYQLGGDECLGAGVISERHWAKFLQNYEELLAGKAEEGMATSSN